MKKYFFGVLICFKLMPCVSQVADNKIVILADVSPDIGVDSVEIETLPIDYIDLEEQFVTYKSKVISKKAKFVLFSKKPLNLFVRQLWGEGFYLIEPGDSIRVECFNGQFRFSGIGASKMELVYRAGKIKGRVSPPKNSKQFVLDNLSDYMETSKYVDEQINLKLLLLDQYKYKLTQRSFSTLKANLIAEIETYRVQKYLTLTHKRNKFGLSDKDLIRIFDSTISKSPARSLSLDSMNLSEPLFQYLYEFTRMEFARNNHFNRALLSSDAKRAYGYYKLIKANYSGLVREKLLSYILTHKMMKSIGFVEDVEAALDDYYNEMDCGEYKKWVKTYEGKARTLRKGQPAPEFELTDINGNKLTNENIKGKIVLMDFWFTGCTGCVQMTSVIKKVEEFFNKDSNIVFLNVSIDKDRNKWIKGISEQKYTVGTGLNAYTSGLGSSHSVVKKYNISSYPFLILMDRYGKIVENPLPDPRADQGRSLIELINQKIAESYDGPYILYKNNKIVRKEISIDATGSIVSVSDTIAATNRLNTSFHVHTDKKGEIFEVRFKKSLLPEPDEFSGCEKLFVISDIEGNFEAFRKLLLAGKVINDKYEWIFGNGHLVLVGDFFDRGNQVNECLWLIYALEEEAREKGGYVHFILGNHEIMNMSGNLSYVQEKYKVNARLMNEEYTCLFGKDSELGRWLRTKNVIEKINDVLFVHGGISPVVNNLPLSLKQINATVRSYLVGGDGFLKDSTLAVILDNKTSPYWYRKYYENDIDRKSSEKQIDSTRSKFEVNKIITGHTIVSEQISYHFNGSVINVDVHHAKGNSEGLLIENGKYYRIDGKEHRSLLFEQMDITINGANQKRLLMPN